MEVTTVTTAPQPPEFNPDKVRIIDHTLCEVHGWIQGNAYNTIERYKKIEGVRDENGYSIYVMSNKWNHPVQLWPNDYRLLTA